MARLRKSAAVAVFATAAMALAGCTDADGPTAGDLGSATGSIEYSYWGNTSRSERVAAVVELFGAEHPDIDVTPSISEFTPYMERLAVRAAGGDLACATAAQNTMLGQYANSGVLAPLEPYIEAGLIDTSAYPEGVLAAGQIDGTQYMIPTGSFMRLVVYNTALAEQSGAGAPPEQMTWDEYADWLRDVQAGLPEGVYASEQEGSSVLTLYSWVLGHGQPVFDDGGLAFDRELLVEWFEYWLALAEEGVVVPASRIADQYVSQELAPLALGETVSATRDIPQMSVTENALVGRGVETTIAAVSNPTNDPAMSSNVLGSNGIAIPASCGEGAAAATFIDFFANDVEAGVAFQSDNGIVANPEVQQALLDSAETPENVKRNITTLQEFTESGNVTSLDFPSNANALQNELRRLFEDAAFGNSTVDEAVDAFFAEAEQLLG